MLTHPSRSVDVHPLLVEKNFDNIFPGEHGRDVQRIVVVLEKTKIKTLLAY